MSDDPDKTKTYADARTMAQSIFDIRYLRQKVTIAHGRQPLADQQSGPAVDIRNTMIHGYADLVALGMFEGQDWSISVEGLSMSDDQGKVPDRAEIDWVAASGRRLGLRAGLAAPGATGVLDGRWNSFGFSKAPDPTDRPQPDRRPPLAPTGAFRPRTRQRRRPSLLARAG